MARSSESSAKRRAASERGAPQSQGDDQKTDQESSATDVKTTVKPVSNAINILKDLGQSGAPATLTQIARRLRINTSTCFNIMRTLVAEGVIDFDPVAKTYVIGFGLLKLVRNAISETEHLAAAKPYMHELAERHGVTVCLWRRTGANRIVLVLAEHSSADLRIHVRAGIRLPVLLGSTGRALGPLLELDEAQLRAEFAQLRWAKPISFEAFWREALKSKARGWAMDDGVYSAGILTISAAIRGPTEVLSPYSLTVLTFSGRHDEREIAGLGEAVAATARKLFDLL
jgi:DNA-binding IclR family transcriptional regulator